MNEQHKRRAIVEQCRAMNAAGLNQGTSGNISVRHAQGMLITPSGMAYDRMGPDDVVFVDADGQSRGALAASSEWRLHAAILQSRVDVDAVVHTHAIHCTALAIRRLSIPPLHYMIAAAGGRDIRCADYATFGTAALSDAVMKALDNRLACLMANHGMIACGASIDQAMWLAVEVETLARQYILSLQLGGPVLLADAEIERVLEKFKAYGRQPEPAQR